MKYSNVANQIPDLIDVLGKIDTKYAYEQRYIGQAIGHLILLKDILDGIHQKENN